MKMHLVWMFLRRNCHQSMCRTKCIATHVTMWVNSCYNIWNIISRGVKPPFWSLSNDAINMLVSRHIPVELPFCTGNERQSNWGDLSEPFPPPLNMFYFSFMWVRKGTLKMWGTWEWKILSNVPIGPLPPLSLIPSKRLVKASNLIHIMLTCEWTLVTILECSSEQCRATSSMIEQLINIERAISSVQQPN